MAYEHYKYDPYVRAYNRIADGGEICSGDFDPKNNPDDRRLILYGIIALLVVGLIVLMCGCTRRMYIPVEHTTTRTVTLVDTVVEVSLKHVHDTVTLPLHGRDTTSCLRNTHSYSIATLRDGVLGHSLGTLPGAKVKDSVKVQVVHVTDSIPYPVEVEKKLTWWQGVKMEYGGIAMGAAIAFGIGMLSLIRRE